MKTAARILSGNPNRLRVVIAGMVALILAASAAKADISCQTANPKTLRSMARVYIAYGQFDKAQPLAKQAVLSAIRRNAPQTEIALGLMDYALVCNGLGQFDDAAALMEKSLQLQRDNWGVDHPYVAAAWRLLAEIYCRQQRPDAAQDALAEAFRIALRYADATSRQMLPFWQTAGLLALTQARLDAAVGCYHTAAALAERYYGAQHLYTGQLQAELAQAAWRAGDLTLALDQIEKAVAVHQRYRRQLPEQWLAAQAQQSAIRAACLRAQLPLANADNG